MKFDLEFVKRTLEKNRVASGQESPGRNYPAIPQDTTTHTEEEKLFITTWRAMHLMPALLQAFGGSLEGKRVLDLGCHDGSWSRLCLDFGAEFALAVDKTPSHYENAVYVRDQLGYSASRQEIIHADIYDLTPERFGTFDIVLFYGLLYHLDKPVYALENVHRLARDIVVIDSVLMVLPESVTQTAYGGYGYPEDHVVMVPTRNALARMLKSVGYADSVEVCHREPRPAVYEGDIRAMVFASKHDEDLAARIGAGASSDIDNTWHGQPMTLDPDYGNGFRHQEDLLETRMDHSLVTCFGLEPYEAAKRKRNDKDYDGARAILEKFIHTVEHAQYARLLGRTYFELGRNCLLQEDSAAAEQAFAKCLTVNPGHPEAGAWLQKLKTKSETG